MSGEACAVFDRDLIDYDFGATHPMNPIRVDLTMRLAEELGVVDQRPLAATGIPVVGARWPTTT